MHGAVDPLAVRPQGDRRLPVVRGLALSRDFAAEVEQLREYEEMGLLLIDEAGILITGTGWYVVSAIAMVFDRYLQSDRNRARFSRII